MNFQIEHIGETDSTNRWLKQHARAEGQVATAAYQTAGRGCGTNSWESAPGQNLLFSVLLCPTLLPPARQFLISMAASLAIADVLSQRTGGVSIKWPNDIYVGDRKICGILIENQLSGQTITRSIVGVGLNVNQTEFLSDAPNPVSLRQLTGQPHDPQQLLNDILARLELRLADPATPHDYRALLYRRGLPATYRDAAGTFTATLDDVADDGRLLLRDEEGRIRTYAFKEVQFVI